MQLDREFISFDNEADWLAARRKDVTSTEAAGLFDAGAYKNSRTFYELFQIKAGLLKPAEFEGGERAKWGNRLEAAIAMGIAEDFGVVVQPFKQYGRIPSIRLASSFDYKIVGLADGYCGDEAVREMFKEYGPGIMEVKNLDSYQFRHNWIEDGDSIEATPQIEFQVAAQLEVSDLKWSLIAPLVGGNTPKVIIRKRDLEVGALIREKVAELWSRIAAGNPPTPDFEKDAEVVTKLYVNNNGLEVDMGDNARLIELCTLYKQSGAFEKEWADKKKAYKAELLTIIEGAKTIHAGAYKISAGTNKESYRAYHREAGERWTITKSVIPPGDIEATVPAYRNVRINAAA